MKVIRNTKEIKRRETIGRRFSLTGMGVLLVGLLISFVPTWYPPTAPIEPGLVGFAQQYWSWLSFACLFGGFFCASVGSYYINRYARRRWPGSRIIERPDEVLQRSMKGFDDKFAYFAQSLPAPYVLAGPNGITIFAVRSDKGRVQVDGAKWREPFSFSRIFTFFAREGVGNPERDLAEQTDRVRSLLAKAAADPATAAAGLETVPIDGVTIFLNAEIQLELNNPTVPVLRADQLKEYVRTRTKEVKVPNATQRALVETLVNAAVFQQEEEAAETVPGPYPRFGGCAILDSVRSVACCLRMEHTMRRMKFTYWQDGSYYIGHLNDYPDYETQGITKDELIENLKSLLEDIESGEVPYLRKVEELVLVP